MSMAGDESCGRATSVGMQRCSKGCGISGWLLSRSSCAMSWAVLEAVQKRGRASHQPICRQVGTTSWIGSIYFSLGRMYQKCHASSSETTSHQNPSLISHFAKKSGPWVVLAVATL